MASAALELPPDPEDLRELVWPRRPNCKPKLGPSRMLKAQQAELGRTRLGRCSEMLERDVQQLGLLIGDLEEMLGGEPSPRLGRGALASIGLAKGSPDEGTRAPTRAPTAQGDPPRGGLRLSGARRVSRLPAGRVRTRDAGVRAFPLRGDQVRPPQAGLPGP